MQIILTPDEAAAFERHPAVLQALQYSTDWESNFPQIPLRRVCAILASVNFERAMSGRVDVKLDVEELPRHVPTVERCATPEEARDRQAALKAATHARRVRLGQVRYQVYAFPAETRATPSYEGGLLFEAVSDDAVARHGMVISDEEYHSAYDPERFEAEVAQALVQAIALADRNAAKTADVGG